MERQHLPVSCNSGEIPLEHFLHSAVMIPAAIRNPFLTCDFSFLSLHTPLSCWWLELLSAFVLRG